MEEVKEPCVYCSTLSEGTGVCHECFDISQAASTGIQTARLVGVSKYGPASWNDVPVSEHLEHALAHVKLVGSPGEDHLSHAICRLAMAKALIDSRG